jgi:kinesin family member 11
MKANSVNNNNNSNSSNMKVVVRIRPLSAKEIAAGIVVCCEPLDSTHVAIRKSGSKKAYLQSQSSDMVSDFAFDRVFGPATKQDELYEQSILPYLPVLLGGQHVTVLAYGATGAGKVHFHMYLTIVH